MLSDVFWICCHFIVTGIIVDKKRVEINSNKNIAPLRNTFIWSNVILQDV